MTGEHEDLMKVGLFFIFFRTVKELGQLNIYLIKALSHQILLIFKALTLLERFLDEREFRCGASCIKKTSVNLEDMKLCRCKLSNFFRMFKPVENNKIEFEYRYVFLHTY